MKRSGSKLIAKAGSVKNINKVGYRFAFELQIESCDQMLGSSDVVCTWERGPKVVWTAPMKVDKNKRVVNFEGASLKQDVTIFKKKKSDATYEPKVYRLAVRSGSETGKIIGKIDLNFADYLELPSFSKRIAAPLNSGGRLVLRVNSRYIGEAEKGKKGKKKGDDETSSVSGSESGIDGYSVEEAEEVAERKRDMQDLDDLTLDDDPKSSSRRNGQGAGTAALATSSYPNGPGGNRAGGDAGAKYGDAAAGRNGGGNGATANGRHGADAGGYRHGGAEPNYDRNASVSSGTAGRYGAAETVNGSTFGTGSSAAAGTNGYGRSNDYGGNDSGRANGYGASGTTSASAAGGSLRRHPARDQPDAVVGKTSSGPSSGGGGGRNGATYAQASLKGSDPENDVSGGHTGNSYGRSAANNRWNGGGPTTHSTDENNSRQEIERLRAENKALRRANDQLEERLAQIDSDTFNAQSGSMEALVHENKTLRRDIEDLEGRLSREPVYSDVVRELRESKMALAFLTLERDELQQKVRSAAPGSGIATRNLL